MHRKLTLVSLFLFVCAAALAQEKAGAALPTEDTVNSFMQQTFGYDQTITWKIASIKPSVAQGLAEVSVTITSTQGQSVTTLYVTPMASMRWPATFCRSVPNPTPRPRCPEERHQRHRARPENSP